MNASVLPLQRTTALSAKAAPITREADTAPANRHQPPVLKRLLLTGLILAAGSAATYFGHQWWTVGRFMESTEDAYVGGEVTVIAPKVPGFIVQVLVSDNQPVHAGDLLLKLDDRDYRAALAKADAAVASQQAGLENLDATRFLQESVVTQAETGIVSAEAETSRARDDQTRYHDLSARGAVSVQSAQKADADYKEAVALGDKSRAALATAQRQLAVIGTQKQQVQAALNQALAEREMARLNLSYTELRAPIDGTVGNRSARTGAYATVGSQLISLVPARGLWIDANFKESQLARMHPGQSAAFTVDVCPGQVLHGRVASLAPATGAVFSVLPPENATGNFTRIVQRVAVRILLDDEASALSQVRPGLSVTVDVDSRTVGKETL
ncbi:MAG: Membrane fusion component of tripartite multidrug resistance system [Verrucomicrobiaceae bacterium]|nr:Membrane fusion component of tripartite multidrug resistance system [Verrucomicrobiaceae bacterium]